MSDWNWGGNDPALILESADVTHELARELVLSAFACSGQICFAIKRVYVHRSGYRALVEALTEVINEIVVGDGLSADSDMGPLISRQAVERVRGLHGMDIEPTLADTIAANGARLFRALSS